MVSERRPFLKERRDQTDDAVYCAFCRVAVPAEGDLIEHHEAIGVVYRLHDLLLRVVGTAESRRPHPAVELALTVRQRRPGELEDPRVLLAGALELGVEHGRKRL